MLVFSNIPGVPWMFRYGDLALGAAGGRLMKNQSVRDAIKAGYARAVESLRRCPECGLWKWPSATCRRCTQNAIADGGLAYKTLRRNNWSHKHAVREVMQATRRAIKKTIVEAKNA
jgi:ribosomal protein L32